MDTPVSTSTTRDNELGLSIAAPVDRVRWASVLAGLFTVLATLAIPGVVLLTPHFILAKQLGFYGSLRGLITTYIIGGQPFAIFLIVTYFLNQSEEIFEAARIDGATEMQALIRVAIPLAWPILMTIAVLNFIGIYSDLIWPSLMLPRGEQTLILALLDEGGIRDDLAALRENLLQQYRDLASGKTAAPEKNG